MGGQTPPAFRRSRVHRAQAREHHRRHQRRRYLARRLTRTLARGASWTHLVHGSSDHAAPRTRSPRMEDAVPAATPSSSVASHGDVPLSARAPRRAGSTPLAVRGVITCLVIAAPTRCTRHDSHPRLGLGRLLGGGGRRRRLRRDRRAAPRHCRRNCTRWRKKRRAAAAAAERPPAREPLHTRHLLVLPSQVGDQIDFLPID